MTTTGNITWDASAPVVYDMFSHTAELTALKAELERKAQYGKEWMDKYLDLRKAAQMALDSITGADYIDCDQHDAANALRKELGL